ncbi:pentapeptide repeat-containing protein [Calothrix sp. PCC 6303]|uniref:pentapeptide repeat-containing protein n=1 Tax=Calothrix sp. PCC 6303 TaxID=1170562 RepID=UPI0002A02D88|nr:pentapeptide repeat-containing protein [Calothrix sp. PCC 6303]AFZ03760.1 pentapeptide repeat protein [Calothrix sp. PCC 6303]
MILDYRRAKLRGESFKGKDLAGADFSYADIRGTDFADAILTGANFSHVKAGLQRRWLLALILFALLLSALSGFLVAIGGSLLGIILADRSRENLYVGAIALGIISVFLVVTFWRGVATASGFLAISIMSAGVAAVLWAGIVALTWAGIVAPTGAMQLANAVGVIVTGAVAVVIIAAGTIAIAGSVALAGIIGGLWTVTLTVLLTVGLCGAITIAFTSANPAADGIWLIVNRHFIDGFTVGIVLLACYLGCLALFANKKQLPIRNMALGLATRRGTNFENSDLTDVDFSQASLKNTNLNQANITRTCWFQVKKLNFATVGKSYLANSQIRHLVVSKNLQSRNLDGWNLQGINLQAANLKDVSLIGANLSESNLRDADISRATLIRAELDKTDFRGAILTGAYIESWHITPDTKLDGVRCDYIFMRVPTKNDPNPHRLPTNWEATLQAGEFSRLFSLSSSTKKA